MITVSKKILLLPLSLFVVFLITLYILTLYSETGNLQRNICRSPLTKNKFLCQTLGCKWTISTIRIPEAPPTEGCTFIKPGI
jgi:hypothetical protein